MAIKRTQYTIRNTQYLKGKRILITAGPTWVPIDTVRVISNIATGETGILLADRLRRFGAKVTLLLGPVDSCCLNKKIRRLNFKFFHELKGLVNKELKSQQYDIIIHSAAVADFAPRAPLEGKINSDKSHNLELLPLPKIIRNIRRLAAKAKLIMFKLEAGISDGALVKQSRQSLITYQADLVIASRIYPKYKAFILDKDRIYCKVNSKKELVQKLVSLI